MLQGAYLHTLEYADSSSSLAIKIIVNLLTLSNTEIQGQEQERIGENCVLDTTVTVNSSFRPETI